MVSVFKMLNYLVTVHKLNKHGVCVCVEGGGGGGGGALFFACHRCQPLTTRSRRDGALFLRERLLIANRGLRCFTIEVPCSTIGVPCPTVEVPCPTVEVPCPIIRGTSLFYREYPPVLPQGTLSLGLF